MSDGLISVPSCRQNQLYDFGAPILRAEQFSLPTIPMKSTPMILKYSRKIRSEWYRMIFGPILVNSVCWLRFLPCAHFGKLWFSRSGNTFSIDFGFFGNTSEVVGRVCEAPRQFYRVISKNRCPEIPNSVEKQSRVRHFLVSSPVYSLKFNRAKRECTLWIATPQKNTKHTTLTPIQWGYQEVNPGRHPTLSTVEISKTISAHLQR